jgi:hypothetical protein
MVLALAAAVGACEVRPTETPTIETPATSAVATQSPSPAPTASPTPSPTALPSGVAAAFATTLTTDDGRGLLEVTVLDRTGLIEGVGGISASGLEEGLTDVEVPHRGLQYVWRGDPCARRTDITLERAEIFGTDQDTYRLSAEQGGKADPCGADEAARAIAINLRKPIAAARVRVVSGILASYRFQWDEFQGRSRTEFELLDRTGLVAGLALPTKLGPGGRISDAEPPDVGVVYWPAPAYCVYRIAMVFEAFGEEQYRLRVSFDARWLGSIDCPASGVGRWVLIQLRERIAASQIREVVEGP